MKKLLLVGALLVTNLISFSAGKGNDVTTKPDVYFLKSSQVVSSYDLLPPPPAVDSIGFLNDKAQYEKGKLLRNTERGKQAYNDAHVEGDGVPRAFSEAFGYTISAQTTPEIFKLVTKLREDAGDLATRSAKQTYMRIRPFAYFKESTCRPEDEASLSTNGSYPSGHTSIGWATALVLAEVNPARQNEIIKRAYEEADNYLKNMQAKAKNLIDKINSEESKKEDAKNAQRSLNMLRESFITDKKKNVKEKKVVTQNVDFSVGEEVLVKTMNQNGKILKIMPNNRIQVQTGILKLVVSTDDIVKIQKKKTNKFKNFASLKRTSQVRGEIDLRGMNADEAIAELETYMDRAMLTGYHEIYIIHGKGTMVLRKKIHEYLRTSKYVTEFKDANQNEGGIGCTVVTLK